MQTSSRDWLLARHTPHKSTVLCVCVMSTPTTNNLTSRVLTWAHSYEQSLWVQLYCKLTHYSLFLKRKQLTIRQLQDHIEQNVTYNGDRDPAEIYYGFKWPTTTKTRPLASSVRLTQTAEDTAEQIGQRERSSWACRVSSYPGSIPAHFGPSAHSTPGLPLLGEIWQQKHWSNMFSSNTMLEQGFSLIICQ